MLRWRRIRGVPWINDVFHKVAVVPAAEADVARRCLQRLYEVPFTVHVDHADLST